jgi:RNA 2',3'-cyclic 3'-phosphodiesterase
LRLFVAVWPPPEVVDRLAAMERPDVPGMRWTGPDQWHVTLRFLGEVPDVAVGDLAVVLRSCASRLAPATVTVGDRTARFGRRVLHVAVDGLAAWAAAVATVEPATPIDDRPFVGHVTLARVADPRRGDLAALAGASLPAGSGTWTATSFDLVRSRLGRGPAVYETIERCSV